MTYTVHGHVLLHFQVNIHVHDLIIVTYLVRSVAGNFLIITCFCGTSNEWQNNRYIFWGPVKSGEFFTNKGPATSNDESLVFRSTYPFNEVIDTFCSKSVKLCVS